MLALAACQSSISEIDGAFYNGDHRLVHCGVNLDTSARNDTASIDSALDRAADRGEVAELYSHKPGYTVPIDKLQHVLQGAQDRGLKFYTYEDFANDVPVQAGLAMSFDDTSVEEWMGLEPMFEQYGAHVTFFVSRYNALSDDQHALLKQLSQDGHAIEAHSVRHMRAPDYVENYGLGAYLRDELDPSIAILQADGYNVTAFAYPFGARTSELDHAIGKRVPVIRSVAFSYSVAQSPCPN